MSKIRYRVLVGLAYPTAAADVAKLQKAALLPDAERLDVIKSISFVSREPGDVVDDIPRESVSWLLRCRAIEVAA